MTNNKKTTGQELLEKVKQSKNKNTNKNYSKIVGKNSKDNGKFRRVNFNG